MRAVLACALLLAVRRPPPPRCSRPARATPAASPTCSRVGQGGNTSALDLARNQADGSLPAELHEPARAVHRPRPARARASRPSNLGRFFKPAGFGVAPARVTQTLNPRPGVTILIDDLEVPHVYGNTRADVAFGAGYASARARLFQMDVLRHTARGELTELVGPGENNANLKMDVEQLQAADYTEAELQRMIDTAAADAGAGGRRRSSGPRSTTWPASTSSSREARSSPTKLPAEYAALGDHAARLAAHRHRGGRLADRRHLRQGRRLRDRAWPRRCARRTQRFGRKRGNRVFADFRALNDPEAPVTTPTALPLPRPAPASKRKVRRRGRTVRRRCRRAVAVPDRGSVRDHDPVVAGPPASLGGARPAGCATCARRRPRARRPGLQRDARARRATPTSGRPLGVTGPQVAYYSPEILLELDLHGGGVRHPRRRLPRHQPLRADRPRQGLLVERDDRDHRQRGRVRRGAVRAGRRRAHARSSTHYRYKGRCVPMTVQQRVLRTPGPSAADTERGGARHPAEAAAHRARPGHQDGHAAAASPWRSPRARSTYFHELDSALAFKRLSRNEVTDAALLPAHDGHDQLPLQLVLQRRARHRLSPVGLVPAARARHRPVAARRSAPGGTTGAASTPATLPVRARLLQPAAQGHQPARAATS